MLEKCAREVYLRSNDYLAAFNVKFPNMKYKVSITSVFECSLERAFKTPMLCDVSKVHTGFGLMPKITSSINDQNWGVPGASKQVIAAKSLTFKGGQASTDHLLERIENKYWKIEVDDFKSWMLGFYKFTGEWETIEIETNRIQINYTYTLHANLRFLAPLQWLFANLFWKKYMHQVLENIRILTQTKEPYKYQ